MGEPSKMENDMMKTGRTLQAIAVPMLAVGLLSSVSFSQRPTLSYGGKLGVAGPGVKTTYLAHPDQSLIQVAAGMKRGKNLAVLLYSLKLLPKGLPFGPDSLDIDPGGLFLTVPGLLDSQGNWKSGFQVPSLVPGGTHFAVQALVWAKGEAAPLRLSRGKQVRVIDGGPLDLYVDGDATKKGNGTPLLPFQTIVEALQVAAIKKGGRVHIEPSKNNYQGKVVNGSDLRFSIGTGTSLLGESWSGTRSGKPTLQGTVSATGSSLLFKNLRVLLPNPGNRANAKCLFVSGAKNVLVENCLFEGATSGMASGVRGIVFGSSVQGEIRSCTIRNLNVGKTTPSLNVGAYGIVLGRGIQATVRNCRIYGFLNSPPSSPTNFYYVNGISCGQNKPESAQNQITIANNVIGPFHLKAPTGNQTHTSGDLFGVIMKFGTQGSIRNNVFHGFDFSALTSQTQQIFGISLYETGKALEVTNNIFWDFKLGKVTGIRWNVAMESSLKTSQNWTYKASHSCIWQVQKDFLGKVTAGSMILKKDPLLLPPVYLLKPGSPCLGTGNPLYPPKNMGIFGGSFAGKAGSN